jgi:hypothetical protein
MTIDWRQSSWLEPSDALNDAQRARHEAALRVLDAYRLSGTPFLLFLRTFKIRQLYCQASEGGEGGDGILLEVHLQRELAQLGANIVRMQNLGSHEGSAARAVDDFNEAPGLVMRHETWRDAVKELIASAELIVSEVQFLTPGVVDELRACRDAEKVGQTVLILPSPPFEFARNKDEIADFPRVIYQHDMNWARPSDSFVFRDLMVRIGRIAMLNDAERALLPVSYDGVAEGMLELAKRYAKKGALGATVFYGN